MFYPVKVTDAKGKVKKILSSKKLSNKYWKDVFEETKAKAPRKRKVTRENKKADLPDVDEYGLD